MHRTAAVLLAGTLLLAGCGGAGEPEKTGKPSRSASPKPKAYDPPKKLAAVGSPTELDNYTPDSSNPASEPGTLVTGKVTASTDKNGLHAVNVVTGKQVTVRPGDTGGSSSASGSVQTIGHGRAVPARIGGKNVILVAYAQTAAGSGTAKSHGQIRLQAVDLATLKVSWAVDADTSSYERQGALGVEGIHVDEGTGLVAVDGGKVSSGGNLDTKSLSVVVDTKAKKTVWQEAGLRPAGMLDGVLVDAKGQQTGSATAQSADADRWRCFDDRRSIVACYGPPGEELQSENEEIVALDTKTGKKAWGFRKGDGSGRTVPSIRSAYHGLVYAETDDAPVALDARTGKDDSAKPQPAPRAVNGYAAVAVLEGKQTSDYSVGYYKTAG